MQLTLLKRARSLAVLCWIFAVAFGLFVTGLVEAQSQTPEIAQPAKSATGAAPAAGQIARGRIYHDRNGDSQFNGSDLPMANVKVSNGLDIVTTASDGSYELSISEDGAIFVIKPSGFRTRLSKENLPQFYYLHKPNGSPKLLYPGVAPTGPLPQSIDFPLYEQEEPKSFRMVLFGDTQPRNITEVDYIAHDVISDVRGIDAAFGVTLGDIVFDDLNVFEPLTQAVGLIGIPWYNVIGNHDINYDGGRRALINETYERHFGPSYYSYDYGTVHFVVMDNIDWFVPTDGVTKPGFRGGFGSEQLQFLKNDLSMIPSNQMVVLMMHIPLNNVADNQDLFRLIEQRPFCISISAHQHYHQHMFLGEEVGWRGAKPHHHIVNVTVCGSWWLGRKDERGIPHAMMADGAPNGYSVMTFDGDKYGLEFVGAGNDRGRQMRVNMPDQINAGAAHRFTINVFNGSVHSQVWYALDGSTNWQECLRVDEPDPMYKSLYDEEQSTLPKDAPKLTKPAISSHLWMGLIEHLEPGIHLLEIKTRDMFGKEYSGQKSFRVVVAPPTGPAREDASSPLNDSPSSDSLPQGGNVIK